MKNNSIMGRRRRMWPGIRPVIRLLAQPLLPAVVFILILMPVLAGRAHAGAPVWKISRGSSHLYIGGTFHVLAPGDYPLPQAFEQAFDRADLLVLETDLDATRSDAFAQKMMTQMVYTDGSTLRNRVSPATFQSLGRFARERGLDVANLNRFKPGLVMVFLTMAQMEEMGMTGTGVDEFFFQKARQKQMPMAFLESPMAQLHFLSEIGNGNEDRMIAYILKDVGELPGLVPTLKSAWRRGDMDTLYRTTLAPLKTDYPNLYQTLMVDRNRNWLPRIQDLLATPEVEFVLVGAAHLAGNQGLLSLLRQKGIFVSAP